MCVLCAMLTLLIDPVPTVDPFLPCLLLISCTNPPIPSRWVLSLITHPFLVLRHQCQLHILYPCPSAPFGSVGALYRAWASQVCVCKWVWVGVGVIVGVDVCACIEGFYTLLIAPFRVLQVCGEVV